MKLPGVLPSWSTSLSTSWLPLVVAGLLAAVLAVALVAGVFVLRASWQAEGAARVVAADREAIIEQQRRDAALSAAIIARQAGELAALSARANALVKRMDDAPRTNGCGPVMRDASRGLHELFGRAGAAPAGRQPAAAVP